MINLIIKGNMFDAFNAAHARGIALLTAAQTFNDRPSEVVASVDDSALDAVRVWFMATSAADLVPGFGYPAGALLFYSDKQSAALNDERPAPARDVDDRRYEYVTCDACGKNWQRIDWGSVAHAYFCDAGKAPPRVERQEDILNRIARL